MGQLFLFCLVWGFLSVHVTTGFAGLSRDMRSRRVQAELPMNQPEHSSFLPPSGEVQTLSPAQVGCSNLEVDSRVLLELELDMAVRDLQQALENDLKILRLRGGKSPDREMKALTEEEVDARLPTNVDDSVGFLMEMKRRHHESDYKFIFEDARVQGIDEGFTRKGP